MARWEAKRIIDVVNDIRDEVYVLPVIQRKFVWKEEQIEDLFDSIMKGYSFGGIIVIEEEKDSEPLFEFRRFASSNTTNTSVRINRLDKKQYFVIDGQQRLQSLFIGMYGNIDNKLLYFNLLSNSKERYDFEFALSKERVETITNDDINKKYIWVSINTLMEKVKTTTKDKTIAQYFTRDIEITEDEIEIVRDNINTFTSSFFNTEALGIAKMEIDKCEFSVAENRQKVVESFKRLNNGGTKLDAFELVQSELKGYAFDMESFISEVESKYSNIGFDTENLLKFCFIIQDKNPKNAFNIKENDAMYIISNRERIEACVKSLDKFLELSFLKDYYVNFSTSFVPLFFIMYHLYHKSNLTNNEIKNYFNNYETGNVDSILMSKLLKLTILHGTFKSKGAGWTPYTTGINKMLEIIKNCKNQPFPYEQFYQLFIDKTNYFSQIIDSEHLDSYNSDFVYYMMYNLRRVPRTNDIDHVMPKHILTTIGKDDKLINNIRNFQLLDYGTNRGEKSDNPLAIWINNHIAPENKRTYIDTHLIPTDELLWDEDRFEEFISARTNLILEKMQYHLDH